MKIIYVKHKWLEHLSQHHLLVNQPREYPEQDFFPNSPAKTRFCQNFQEGFNGVNTNIPTKGYSRFAFSRCWGSTSPTPHAHAKCQCWDLMILCGFFQTHSDCQLMSQLLLLSWLPRGSDNDFLALVWLFTWLQLNRCYFLSWPLLRDLIYPGSRPWITFKINTRGKKRKPSLWRDYLSPLFIKCPLLTPFGRRPPNNAGAIVFPSGCWDLSVLWNQGSCSPIVSPPQCPEAPSAPAFTGQDTDPLFLHQHH